MSKHERNEILAANMATGFNVTAASRDDLVAVLHFLLTITSNVMPMGIGASIKTDASLIAHGIAVQT